MKAALPILLATIVVAGCTPTPEASTGTEPKPEPTAPAKETPAIAPEKGKINPNRAHQLADLETRKVTLGGKPYELWVMNGDTKRQEGMMYLTDEDVRDDQGMLFVFPAPQTEPDRGFFMKNTILPLDIIFIAPDKKVLNIQQGEPYSERNLPAAATFQYVIELKKGQAKALGIKPGTKIELPKDVEAID